MTLVSKTIKVYGKVQNVGFRFYTKKKANELGLSGFVKNMTDGSVYIEVTGEENIVEQLINWCHFGSGPI
jgi:acylphosphatase